MKDYGREVGRLLRLHGWTFHRAAKGDHELWAAEHSELKITVDGTVRSGNTENGIMKRAKIAHRF